MIIESALIATAAVGTGYLIPTILGSFPFKGALSHEHSTLTLIR